VDGLGGDVDFTTVRNEQESIISGAGNLERIIGVVSSYWDKRDAKRGELDDSSTEVGRSVFGERSSISSRNTGDDRVGYLDPVRTIPSKANHVVIKSVPQTSLAKSSMKSRVAPEVAEQSQIPLPDEVRMITYSDAIPRPELPPPPAPALPSLSESPLALLAAASGGKLDLHWLETFDNSTLETLVPRDPQTGRPLTIGSIDHAEGKCRPCVFFVKAKCFKGLKCSFCHFNHTSLRKPTSSTVDPSNIDLQQLLFSNEGTAKIIPPVATAKSKRLRPSKRTREMIKQINEQMMYDDTKEDPNGPPLCVSQISSPP
jgi:hypothetical protein